MTVSEDVSALLLGGGAMRIPLRMKVSHLLGLVAAVAVVLGFDSVPGGCACGSFGLDVTLTLPEGRKVVGVAALPMGDLEFAERLLEDPGNVAQECHQMAYAPGQPFEVRIPFSRKISSLLGRPLSRSQFHAVLLRLDHADGTTQLLARAVPDSRASRPLTVVVP